MKQLVIFFLIIVSFTTTAQPDGFKKVSYSELNENAITLIGKEWMLITAGTMDAGFNMMTASWGTLGWLWEKPVAFTFVRPQRYTHVFTEKEEYFTLTFFEEKDKEFLRFCGTKSGRDYDKVKETGLKPFAPENGSVAFEQARIIIECRKLYAQPLSENAFTDKTTVERTYPNKDFHTMYVGEILNIWIRE